MALTDKLIDIADAIRAKTGDNDPMTLVEMAEAIEDLSTGGAELPSSLFTITGVGDFLFSSNRFQYLVETYASSFNINVSSAESMFDTTSYQIPTSMTVSVNNGTLQKCFYGTSITAPPIVNGTDITNLSNLFTNSTVSTIPSNWFSNIEFKDNNNTIMINSMFVNAKRLRGTVNLQTHKSSNFYTITNNNNYVFPGNNTGMNGSMSALINVPVFSTTNSSMRAATSGPSSCYYLKRLTFSTDNGTPFVARLANWTLDCSAYTGYQLYTSNLYNNDGSIKTLPTDLTTHYSELTEAQIKDLQIYDAASYARLKNNDDAFSLHEEYSTYNKTSALETIATLPDTSAYGTNIIKFKGNAGSLTDGGAINTMTAAEIAVATAKGWTVTFV